MATPRTRRLDGYGDALPSGAVARLGTERLKGPSGTIAVSPDSEWVAGADNNLAAVWSARTGERKCAIRLETIPRHPTTIERVTFGRGAIGLAVDNDAGSCDVHVYGTDGRR